ncbi:MAG: bifunctional glutamate N-acetyltransferase/amino-acid acetyltransferase ArgJ [Deltaproteobacteria bacterium]|nr:bifunctional glutamate N-acetyltransferase/amino-acid acetyltransferase ArgJ [Deltaproteobacteria bacterium]
MRPKGFQAAGITCGIKETEGAKDLALIYSEVPAKVAGLFTRNRVKAAPVIYTRRRVRRGICQALIINSGNANACTGQKGLMDAETMARLIASTLHIPHQQVLVSSTGVIGRPLPMGKIERGIPSLVAKLSPDGFQDAAEAILTTDTCSKVAMERVDTDGEKITIFGMAKGAGMIHPQLATMLAFILTDAEVEAEVLSALLQEGVRCTFNRITVDGDTSTNDMILLVANGEGGSSPLHPGDVRFRPFREALFGVMDQLTQAIVRDGEGRTKVVEIVVRGASSSKEAEKLAFRVAHSPLVKTAFFGQDPNWGRIMAAMGDAGVPFDPQKVAIYFDGALVVEGGIQAQGIREDRLREVLKKEEFKVVIDLHRGTSQVSVLTTDLSYDYVRINASYHT